MTRAGAALVLSTAILGTSLVDASAARPTARQCRALCADEIVGCEAVGNRPRTCRKYFVRRCRRTGGGICRSVPTTSTSTTLRTPTTAFPFPTTSSPEPSSTSSSSTLATTTSSTSTTTLPSWFTSGPIQWAVVPPDVVAAGEHFPLALDVGAAATRVEGHIRSCAEGSPPQNCSSTDGAFTFEPSFFAGDPGRFELDVTANPQLGCPGVVGRELFAEIFLYDGDAVRHGPFYSPLTHAAVAWTRPPVLNTYSSTLTFGTIAGMPVAAQAITYGVGCPSGTHTVSASSDAAWLGVAPGGPGYFFVTPDSASLDPALSPYVGHVTLTATGVPDPTIVTVTLYIVPLSVHWTTPPPETVEPESTFPIALEVTGDGIDAVEPVLDPEYADRSYPYPPIWFTWDPPSPPPGVIEITGHRGSACVLTARDAEIDGWVHVKLHDGPWITYLPLPPAPFTLAPMTTLRTSVFANALDQQTIVGGSVPPGRFGVSQNCGPAQTWTASTDVGWLTTKHPSGRAQVGGILFTNEDVLFDPVGLPASETPYAGTVTVSAPGITGGSVDLGATLEVVPGLSATWAQQPPATVTDGDQITAALTLSGDDIALVAGQIQACQVGSIDICTTFTQWVAFTDAGTFGGPPGTFAFAGERQHTCDGHGKGVLRVSLTAIRKDGTPLGPFLVRSDVFDSVASTKPYIVYPAAIVLSAVEGQSPFVRTLQLVPSYCASLAWTLTADVPWIILPATAGTTLYRDAFAIGVDTTGLAPGLHEGTVTFHTPGAYPAETAVPISVDVFAAAE